MKLFKRLFLRCWRKKNVTTSSDQSQTYKAQSSDVVLWTDIRTNFQIFRNAFQRQSQKCRLIGDPFRSRQESRGRMCLEKGGKGVDWGRATSAPFDHQSGQALSSEAVTCSPPFLARELLLESTLALRPKSHWRMTRKTFFVKHFSTILASFKWKDNQLKRVKISFPTKKVYKK